MVCHIRYLPSGTSITVNLTVRPEVPGTLSFAAEANGRQQDPDRASNAAEARLNVASPSPTGVAEGAQRAAPATQEHG